MSTVSNFLAVDLGASSGRVVVGHWDGSKFSLEELHRFSNGGVTLLGHMHWDVLRLWSEICDALTKYCTHHTELPAGISVDSWGVDFGLLDSDEVRAEAERVLAAPPWPTGWEAWRPDPSWPAPALPDGWDVVHPRGGGSSDPEDQRSKE